MDQIEALRQRIRRREWEDSAKRATGSKATLSNLLEVRHRPAGRAQMLPCACSVVATWWSWHCCPSVDAQWKQSADSQWLDTSSLHA